MKPQALVLDPALSLLHTCGLGFPSVPRDLLPEGVGGWEPRFVVKNAFLGRAFLLNRSMTGRQNAFVMITLIHDLNFKPFCKATGVRATQYWFKLR